MAAGKTRNEKPMKGHLPGGVGRVTPCIVTAPLSHPGAHLRMRRIAVCVLLAGSVWLSGCTTSPATSAAAVAPAPDIADPELLLARAREALAIGHHPEAARLFLQAARLSDDEQVAEDAARVAFDHGQLQAAQAAADRWLEINPTSQRAREIAALAALRLYRVDQAVPYLAESIKADYITPGAGFTELWPQLAQADVHAATAVMKELVKQFDEVAEAHFALSRLAEQTSHLALMTAEAQRAQTLAPYWAPGVMQLAKAQLVAGHKEAALTTAKSVAGDDSTAEIRAEYASLLVTAGRIEEGVALLRSLETAPGDTTVAQRALAQLDIETGQYSSAFTRLNKLLNTGKNLSESIFTLASIAERTGALSEARQLYARVQDGPFAMNAQLRLAGIIAREDGLDAALNSLETYGESNPHYMVASVTARADLLSDSGDLAGALTLLDETVAIYPDVAQLRLSRAFLLLRMDKNSAGIAALRELLATRPEDPLVLNALGYTLVERTRNHREGQELIARALAYTPDSGAVLDSMGWALFKLGQKQEALTYLERAKGRILDPDLDQHLGEVLWSLGRRDEAIETWRAGVMRFPDNEALKERLKRHDRQSRK